MSRVQYTTQAQEDIVEIAFYIAQDNAEAADRLMGKILRACDRLGASPRAGRAREELAPGLRSFPVGKYLIFYRPIPGGIEVIRVLHGARDIPSLF
jgi:toxin ParE1/3/4